MVALARPMDTVPDWPTLVAGRLLHGRDRARTIGELAESMGVPRRTVEKAIEQLRADGRPIVTGSEGVWLTDSADELRAAYRALRRRYITQAIGARVLLATARRYEKVRQLELAL
jgi:Mn-dependent DtxR family transcriptional regulator